MYVVFRSYYKHAGVDTCVINSHEEMRAYCINELESYYETKTPEYKEFYKINPDPYGNVNEEWVKDYVAELIDGYTLDELIKLTVRAGNKYVAKQYGCGVRYIFRGNNIVDISS